MSSTFRNRSCFAIEIGDSVDCYSEIRSSRIFFIFVVIFMIVFVVVSWHSWPVSKTIAKTLEDARIIARRLKWCQTFVRIARDPLADINCLLSDCMDARNRSLWRRKAMFKRSAEWGRVARTSKNRLKLESLNFIFLLFTSVWGSRGTITSKSAADWTLLDRLFVLEYGRIEIRVSWGLMTYELWQ